MNEIMREIVISGYKSEDTQLRLWDKWDKPIGNHGNARVVIGELVEELTEKLTGGRRHKTNSLADYCPDVSVAHINGQYIWYYECKAAGKNRETFIYGGRLKKDREFAKQHSLYYIIWHHTTDTTKAETELELRKMVKENMKFVYAVPFVAIDQLCSRLKLEKLNSGYGNPENPLYGEGYRLKLRYFDHWKIEGWRRVL